MFHENPFYSLPPLPIRPDLFCVGPTGEIGNAPVRIESDSGTMTTRVEYEYPAVRPLRNKLKIGYVVRNREGSFGIIMPAIIADPFRHDGFSVQYDDGTYDDIGVFNDDLTNSKEKKFDIMAVYGFSTAPEKATEISGRNRKLIWERTETKKMTVKEICDALGYDVEIVKEGEK